MSNEAHARAGEPAASAEEYEAFHAVLSATARGRAFLDEHARRHRHEETDVLLAALKRLASRRSASPFAEASWSLNSSHSPPCSIRCAMRAPRSMPYV